MEYNKYTTPKNGVFIKNLNFGLSETQTNRFNFSIRIPGEVKPNVKFLLGAHSSNIFNIIIT